MKDAMDELWLPPKEVYLPTRRTNVVTEKNIDYWSNPRWGGFDKPTIRLKIGEVFHTAQKNLVEVVDWQGGWTVSVKVLDSGQIIDKYPVKALLAKKKPVKLPKENKMQVTVPKFVPEQQTANQSTDVVTMSSIELVDYINTLRAAEGGYVPLRHDNFMTKVEKVLGNAAPKFLGAASFTNGTGGAVSRNVYNLPKREATLMAMSYSHEISAQIYDRMEELERAQTPQIGFQVPKSFAQALLLAAEQAQVIEAQAASLSIAAPKVKFHEDFVSHDGTLTATEVAKKIGISAIALNRWLLERDAIFSNRQHFKSWYMDKGFGVEKFTPVVNGAIRHTLHHTTSGADWILSNYGAVPK